jgi:hypothetical protein
LDVASGATETLLQWDATWETPKLYPRKRHLWIANNTGPKSGKPRFELVALDWASGKVVQRSQREIPLAAQAGTRELIESADGAVWLLLSARVERLDASGTWQGWALNDRTPSKLVAARFGVVCLLQQFQQPAEPHFSGSPYRGPAVLRREIAAFQPGMTTFMTYPVETDVNLLPDRNGGVQVEGRGRLLLEGGRLRIAP